MSILKRIRNLFRKTELDSAVNIYEDEPDGWLPDGLPRYDPLAVQEDVCYFNGPGLCGLPPAGWHCTLWNGHEGPCPTWPDDPECPCIRHGGRP